MNQEETAGSRIKVLRKKAGLTREAFEEKVGISRHTIRALESGDSTITKKKATLFSNVFNALGILCSEDYILFGKNLPSDAPLERIQFSESIDYEMSIYKEIEHFQRIYPDHLILKIEEDHYGPFLMKGDIVAGIKTTLDKPLNVNKPNFFICELYQSKKILRKIVCIDDDQYGCLIPNVSKIDFEYIKPLSLARVTHHWRLSEL